MLRKIIAACFVAARNQRLQRRAVTASDIPQTRSRRSRLATLMTSDDPGLGGSRTNSLAAIFPVALWGESLARALLRANKFTGAGPRVTRPARGRTYPEARFSNYIAARIDEALITRCQSAFWPCHSELTIIFDFCFFPIRASEIARNIKRIFIPAMYGQQEFSFLVVNIERTAVGPCLIGVFSLHQMKFISFDPGNQLVVSIENISVKKELSVLEFRKHKSASPNRQQWPLAARFFSEPHSGLTQREKHSVRSYRFNLFWFARRIGRERLICRLQPAVSFGFFGQNWWGCSVTLALVLIGAAAALTAERRKLARVRADK
jgi:hypothetical protein